MADETALDYGIDFQWVVHETAAPPLGPDGLDRTRPDVVVVGAGPTGLTLAAGLARFGVRTVVLEAGDTVCQASRASGISDRTFETINRVAPGRGDLLAARSIPTLGSESFFGERLVLSQSPPRAADGTKFAPNNYLPQWHIESGLLEEVERAPGAEVRWQHAVTGAAAGPEEVELTVSTPAGPYRLRAPWVVAADGGRSVVRRSCGLRMNGLAYDVTFVIVDVKVEGPAPTPPPIRRVWFDPHYLPGGLLLRHMSPDGVWRMDFQFPIGSDLDRATEPGAVTALVREHLRAIGHEADEVRPIWISTYQARALSLDRYRHGRVLFAGDAAHLVPIFGGFGLNSSVDDAENLHWKLALVSRGLAGGALLDTYSEERVAAVRRNLDLVTRAAEFMTPTSAESEELRQAALTLAAEGNTLAAGLGRHRPFRPMRYSPSIVCVPDDPPMDGGFRPGERAGRGHLTQASGARCYLPDLFGGALNILVFDHSDAASSLAAVEEAAAAVGAPIRLLRVHPPDGCTDDQCYHDVQGTVAADYGATAGAVYLVRPDGVVAARWPRPGRAELAATLTDMLGDVDRTPEMTIR
ncbi:FAD-dependent monooxygenase [Actinomadura macra]|uniref:FAD-dependent monooxygenase n=1 Tax=Actinomadura macra TaxID=46164 RepID=UPI0008319DAC|nr:FAD-dependent monooxygenase [Actinomadura macra]